MGLCCVGFLVLLFWLPAASVGQLKALLLVLALVLAFLVVAVVTVLKEFHVARSLANGAATRHWKRNLPGCKFFQVSYLAMYPQTGEGFTFARTAIDHAVPAGAGIHTEARSTRHRAIYTRVGLHPLPSKAGIPTLAMGAITAQHPPITEHH